MTGNEPVLRAKGAEQKKHGLQKGKKHLEKGTFGHARLKHFVLLLGFLIIGGIFVQVIHAPATRVLYWEDGSCFSCLKLDPSQSDLTSAGPLPALFVFNDLGYPAECSKMLGNYFAGCGMTVFLFDYFAAPLTMDGTFRFVGYFQQFTNQLVQTAQVNASNLYFIGFGLGATCALTLAETLPPRALIAVNAISNISRVIMRSGLSPRDTQEAMQWAYWDTQLQNYGYTAFFSSLNESRLSEFTPTLHVSRSQSNTTLLVRTSGDPACTSQDQDELRERIHCEVWAMSGDGKNAMLDTQFHGDLREWLQGEGLENLTLQQPISVWVHATYVPATGLLLGMIGILLIRPLKSRRETHSRSIPRRLHPRATGVASLLINAAGCIVLIFNWGCLFTLVWVNCCVVGIHLLYFFILWRKGTFQLHTWRLEEQKTPRNDLLGAVGIYGSLLLLSVVLSEPLFLPRGRNIPYLIVLCIEWGGFYLINQASSVEERRSGGGFTREVIGGASFRIFGTITLMEEWTLLNNPVLLNQYPFTFAFFAGFTLFALFLPKLTLKLDFISLFLTLGFSCCFF